MIQVSVSVSVSVSQAFHNKVKTTLNCLEGHLHIQGDSEPSPVVLREQTTVDKTTQRFRAIASTLAELNAEGLGMQTVNDLLTVHVGAVSQHVLRMSLVSEHEATTFDTKSRCILVATRQT